MSPFFPKRLLRQPIRSVAVLIVSALLSSLLCFLFSYLEGQKQKLDEVRQTAEVLCVVTDPSGTRSTSLHIGPGGISAVTQEEFYELPKYVRDLRLTKEFEADLVSLGAKLPLIGVMNERCAADLDPARGGTVRSDRGDLFTTDDMICLVSSRAYVQLDGLTKLIGAVTDPMVAAYSPERATVETKLTVVGYYIGDGDAVYIPFNTAMALCDRVSGGHTCDSIAFLAADNTKLNELSAAASEVFGTVSPGGQAGAHRFALTIHDESFRETVAALEQNIKRTGYLLPLSAVLTLLAGFLIGFLSTRGELRSYALMRTVGLTKTRLFLTVFAEQLVLPFLACAAAGAIFLSPLPAACAFLLYALGCLAAVVKSVSHPPTRLLKEQD